MQIRDRVFGAQVSKEIIKRFKELAGGGLSGTDIVPLESRNPTFEKYLGDRTTFARMWAAVTTYPDVKLSDADEKKHTKKEKQRALDAHIARTAKNTVYVINENRENSYDKNPNEPIIDVETVYKSQLSKNPYSKPPAGVTSVSSKTEGSLGSLKRTTVDFIVHNKNDFDNIFLPYFLRPGARVCVDFGWSDMSSDELYDPVNRIKNKDLKMQEFDTFIYGSGNDPGFLNKPQNLGLMNTVMGDVVSYDAKLTELGSFECSLELVSRNTALLDKDISEGNDLKFIFTNFIEDYLLQLFIYRFGVKSEDHPRNMDAYKDVVIEEERKKLFDQLSKPQISTGIIDNMSSQLGFFYQDISDGAGQAGQNDKEMIYISYGLFEDLFLNKIVVNFYDKDNKEVDSPNLKSQVNYNSNGSFIRYHTDLIELQKAPLMESDPLPTFLYPEMWHNSYNANPTGAPQGRDERKKEVAKLKKDGKIPIRELFISVPLIKDSFATSNNVNDALVKIFASINEDSYDILNIQMSENNPAGTSISFQDINILPPIDEQLVFDVTSQNSIVKTADLSFKTPKSGLSSMIAISNLSQPTVFTRGDLADFNMLNMLKKDNNDSEKMVVRSLPISSNDDLENAQAIASLAKVDIEGFSEGLGKVTTSTVGEEQGHYVFWTREGTAEDASVAISDYYAALKTAKVEAEKEAKEDKTKQKNKDANKSGTTKETTRGTVVHVQSYRQAIGTRAKLNKLMSSGTNTVAPILPVELTLSVYGNNYLNVGDTFSVNFLPRHYQDRVFFQIMGIDHKISTADWETTYNTVMRVRSDKKKLIYGADNDDDAISKYYVSVGEAQTKVDLLEKTSLIVDPSIADSVVENIPIATIGPFSPSAWTFPVSSKRTDVKGSIGDKEITKDYNPYALEWIIAGNGLLSNENIAMIYALTTLLIPNKSTSEYFNLDMDKVSKGYRGTSSGFNVRKDLFTSDGKGDDLKFLANHSVKQGGESGLLLKAIDDLESEWSSADAWKGLSTGEELIAKFIKTIHSQFALTGIKYQEAKFMPAIDTIVYNLNNEDFYYQINTSLKAEGHVDTFILVPRLMKQQPFGIGEVRRFFREFALRQLYFINVLNELESGGSILRYKSQTLNPGYPFIQENWNLPTPEVAEARRTAMFEKWNIIREGLGQARLNSWPEYRDTISSPNRKQYWDNNPDLWEVGI